MRTRPALFTALAGTCALLGCHDGDASAASGAGGAPTSSSTSAGTGGAPLEPVPGLYAEYWLIDKVDGNSQGQPTPIRVRRLAPDGLGFAPGSDFLTILVNDGAIGEGGVVEAPWLVKRDGSYYLFYSGNVYDHRYRTGVARAAALAGPYEKHGAPILANNERWVGPGHGSVVSVSGKDYFVYHAWTNDGAGAHLLSAGRHVLVDRIAWNDGWPSISDGTPSRTPQPWPGVDR